MKHETITLEEAKELLNNERHYNIITKDNTVINKWDGLNSFKTRTQAAIDNNNISEINVTRRDEGLRFKVK